MTFFNMPVDYFDSKAQTYKCKNTIISFIIVCFVLMEYKNFRKTKNITNFNLNLY